MNELLKIGTELDTDAVGFCTVTDVYVSMTNSNRYCYEVTDSDKNVYIFALHELGIR